MMVRRTLELLCSSHGIAPNGDLANRIAGLREKVILPAPLIDGLTELRWLGNDAAHVEARNFSEVGAEEVRLGVAVAREILKSLYQMDEFVAKLQDLRARKPSGTEVADESILVSDSRWALLMSNTDAILRP